MSDSGICRKCNQQIFWFKSRAGKPYPCDSDSPRAFHQCPGPKAPASPAKSRDAAAEANPFVPQATQTQPQTKAVFIEQRLAILEGEVRRLRTQVEALQPRAGHNSEDCPF